MRRDWRGPSSSSTISSVRLRGLLGSGGAKGLEGVSKGNSEGMADELIATIGGFNGSGKRVGVGRTARNRPRRAKGQLIGCVPTQPFIRLAQPNAENVAIRVGDNRVETRIGNRVLAVDITGAHAIIVPKIVRRAEFVEKARSPVKRELQRRTLLHYDRVQAVPIGPIHIDFEIPIGHWTKGNTPDDVSREMKLGAG